MEREIAGHTLEFIDDSHTYLVDGIIVPSITQILSVKFGRKYASVNRDVLQRASEAGTQVHEAIERWCRFGEESDLVELRNFKFLMKHYDFSVVDNEVPVILFDGDEPISAGRLDLVLQRYGKFGGADIKRTSTLDKDYLFYQLNLYRIAYRQCYGVEWEFLRAIHLKDNTRRFLPIPIDEELAWEIVNEWRQS